MSYLPEVEKIVRDVVQKLETQPMETNSDVDEAWVQFSVAGLLLVGKWQEAESVGETLTKLLVDNDRRVMVLAMIYLGLMKKLLSNANVAIDRINDIAERSNEKIIGIATGISNAMLGYGPAIKWANNEMRSTNNPSIRSSSIEAFYKNSQLIVVVSIAQGWK